MQTTAISMLTMLTSLHWVSTKTENCHKPVHGVYDPSAELWGTTANQKVRTRQSQAERKPDPQVSVLERVDSHTSVSLCSGHRDPVSTRFSLSQSNRSKHNIGSSGFWVSKFRSRPFPRTKSWPPLISHPSLCFYYLKLDCLMRAKGGFETGPAWFQTTNYLCDIGSKGNRKLGWRRGERERSRGGRRQG